MLEGFEDGHLVVSFLDAFFFYVGVDLFHDDFELVMLALTQMNRPKGVIVEKSRISPCLSSYPNVPFPNFSMILNESILSSFLTNTKRSLRLGGTTSIDWNKPTLILVDMHGKVCRFKTVEIIQGDTEY